MTDTADRAVAIVGVGAILPDAPTAPAFWQNICNRRYSIIDVPPERWSIADYYDPDPHAPDKTYSKIGGWVRGFEFDWKRFRIPPRVAAAMDQGQQWAVTIAAEALADYGYPDRPLDLDRTGVILGTAMGGELHYHTHERVMVPAFAHALEATPEFRKLPVAVQTALINEWRTEIGRRYAQVTEDTMPGELPNIVSGRVANVLGMRGPNFITDAACASALAAIDAAVEQLLNFQCDAIITGGVDRNMGVSTFVKFCKIGALSATGTRPFGDGADGFVMGEGSGAFLLKRLADAERDGDRIYAVIRGVGASSDGKGKGITAPNPAGQVIAIERAWKDAGLDPATATLVEAHGTSTRVGDVVEHESLATMFGKAERNSIGLGSAKSNIGHLKAGAGAAGMLKTTMAVYHKVLPPTLNGNPPNPNIDFKNSPFFLLNEMREWERRGDTPRRAGVSAYGFGGTNFHIVVEEYVPGMLRTQPKTYTGASVEPASQQGTLPMASLKTPAVPPKAPIRGILMLGASDVAGLRARFTETLAKVQGGWTPPVQPPGLDDIRAPERLVVDFSDHAELLDRLQKAQRALATDAPPAWRALQAQGVFRGSGKAPGKVAFLFPGQGSQYTNMGRPLAEREPVVKAIFEEADRVMTPILGRPLTDFIFVDAKDAEAMKQAERALMQTAITQPAMLTTDTALAKLLGEYGFTPDMVMGHSLGEYGALISAGIMPFADALEASAARGAEMTKVSMDDNGWMAAVMAPLDVIQQTIAEVDGYVVAANINSSNQCVIGGASKAVETAIGLFTQKGFQAQRIPVSHAFHTKIVAPASKPLRKVLDRLHISEPKLPLVANVTGDLYPTTIEGIKDILEQQIAATVQWVKGLETLYREGVRVFVEVGPKKALKGFVDDVLGSKPDVVSLFTNHPKTGELQSFNHALCGLYAAGIEPTVQSAVVQAAAPVAAQPTPISVPAPAPTPVAQAETTPMNNGLEAIGLLLAQALQQAGTAQAAPRDAHQYDRNLPPDGSIVITGTGLGLPGALKPVMDPDNALRILRGEQFIDLIPERYRNAMLRKNVTRVVKSADGSGSFETIIDPDEVIKLAGRPGSFDLAEEYGVPAKLIEALDITTQLAIAAGLDALHEAGIPLVQTYRRTTTGRDLPDRLLLPEALRDDTGIIFASAFPGGDRMADEFKRYYAWENRRAQLTLMDDLRRYTSDPDTLNELSRRAAELREELEREPYAFDRRFIFRILAMGHSQFAEYIGARGPNTHVNAACAATTQGIALAEDWIRAGRCRRVIVVAADNVTSDNLMEWVGAGFLATGAAATDDRVEEAALPFDRRRHGTILGMGAAALVVESEDAVRERGMRGIVEVLSSETSNSAFHGTRLDVEHISMVMNNLVTAAERRFGVDRRAVAAQTVFVSHETFTPARGGSASAEVMALRTTFGEAAGDIVMANTKGFTGHPMGVGIEDVIGVKILEYGIVPPVPNLKEIDPDLGPLTLSRGGRYPVQYAVHLAAGFGSQIAMTFTRRIPGALDRVENRPLYLRWLADVSGYDQAETEIVKRVLRIKAQGAPNRRPAPNAWRYGTGPTLRAAAPGDGKASAFRPAPLNIAPPVAAPTPPPAATNGKAVHTPALAPVAPAPAPVAPAPAPVAPAPVAQAPTPAPAPVAPAPVAPAPTPVVVAAAPVAKAPAVDQVAATVMGIVAGKTGYPPEMLDLELDLEADLGIDTVKQAEVFVAIREAFDIPRLDNLKLRDYPTLASVVGFVKQQRPDLAVVSTLAAPAPVAVAPTPVVSAPVPSAPATDMVVEKVLAIVAEKTGYPSEMLDMELDLEADLGIDTVKQAEVFVAIREAFDIPRLDNLRLRDYPTLASVAGFVKQQRPDLAVVSTPAPVVAVPAPAPVAATPAPVLSAPVGSAVDPVIQKVLEIVADKTGYPPEMLDMELDLEADLGIDTVKQAEVFVAIREAFDIPRLDNLKLRDYPTLASVAGFVKQQRPDLAVVSTPVPVVSSPPPAPAPVVAAPAPAPVAVPVVSAPMSSAADPVVEKVLAVVADKTGYPTEMLDLELDLEADLGIDTVKQAEVFVAIREAFDIPRQDNLKLRDYPTLASVIGFVYTMKPELKASSSQKSAVSSQTTPAPVVAAPVVNTAVLSAPAADMVAEKVLAVVADKTGYPTEMLDLELDLEADLGIDTVKQAEVFVAIREAFDIPRQDDLKLRDYPTLASVIGFVYTMKPELKASSSQKSEISSQTTAAPVAPAPVAAPVVPAASATDVVVEKVLAVVADKTGYPTEMLDLELDLEADLGIDTVKQAEVFVAIREAFGIPRQDDLKLRDYPTLASVIGFVYTMKPELKASSSQKSEISSQTAAAPVAPAPVVAATPRPATIGTLEDADRMPRRVPVPALRPPLELCKPSGVTLGEGSRVVVMSDQSGVGKKLIERLQKRGVTVLAFESAPATDAMETQLKDWLAEAPIQGIYWLPALDVEQPIEDQTIEEWRELNRVRVKNLYTAMRTLYESVAGTGRFLVSATRLGGLHGYGPEGASAPMGGAVTGFTKAYNIEQGMRDEGKGTLVKAVDFEVSRRTAEPADILIAETLADPGAVEIGYNNGQRFAITLEEQPARDGKPGMVLNSESVFVVTGAAGGITSAIVTDLAVASQGVFYLLDLVAAPARDDENVRLFRTDREALKRKLIDEARGRGERPTPATIDKQIMGIERSEAALRAIEAVEAAGGTAHYHSLDLRDDPAVAKVVDVIRERHGKIDVILHAGGLLIDRVLPNKEPQQFALVFDVKADGFFSLIKAAKGLPIGATVSFSSVAGRFGNNGQSDYSSANDLLCKISSSMRTWRPETRGIAIDWTAWGQIGMASRGSVPQIMEALGIDMLAPEAGVPTIRRELTYGGTRGELVVAGRLGAWMAEKDPTGGLDVAKVNAQLKSRARPFLMLGEVKAFKLYGGLEVETTFDPTQQPFLFDHQIDGVPVLPGVMGTEAFAELAAALAPGYRVAGVEHEQFQAPFKFYRNQPRTLYMSAVIKPDANGDLLAHTTLRSITRPRPELPERVDQHFSAVVRLTQAPQQWPEIEFTPPSAESLTIGKERIYQLYFHGPAYQVLERVGVEGNKAVALMVHDLGPNSSPAEVESLMSPRLIEFCFQAAGIWEMKTRGTMALPLAIGSVTAYRAPESAEGRRLYALVEVVNGGEYFDTQVVDEAGNVYVVMHGYRTVQFGEGVVI